MESLRKNFRWFALGAIFIGSSIIWYAVFEESVTNRLEVDMLDIGQGDAIFIKAPGGEETLVDGGPNRSVLSALSKVMPFYDRSIDLLMVSNPDSDHIAGLVDVLNSYHVGAILIPGTKPDTEIYKSLLAAANRTGAKIIEARRGEKVSLGGGAFMEILFPDRDPSGLDTNTGSLIARLVYGKTSMLFTGDAPTSVEDYLISIDGKKLESDILKVAHHGSKNSVSLPFYGVVNPQIAAISVGAGNTYGHPNKETLDALNQFQIKTLRTDQLGTIKFISDGEKFVEE